jgi:hypothetical protein
MEAQVTGKEICPSCCGSTIYAVEKRNTKTCVNREKTRRKK